MKKSHQLSAVSYQLWIGVLALVAQASLLAINVFAQTITPINGVPMDGNPFYMIGNDVWLATSADNQTQLIDLMTHWAVFVPPIPNTWTTNGATSIDLLGACKAWFFP